jgi:nucleotide-binding universal stress UspA family protein
MDKHLLLTLGTDAGTFHKIRFVSDFFTDKGAVNLTLFYVAPRQMTGEEAGAPACDVSRGKEIAEQGRDMLVQRGFDPGRIETKLTCRRKGTVQDIREEAEAGLYDAVVLGCRGLGWLSELVESSVSQGLLNQDIPFPIWVCNRPETGGQDILLCMDDSDHSLRMADHVGFMLTDQPEGRVVLLHVNSSSGEPAERAVEGARTALAQNGVPEDRVETRLVEASDVDSAILGHAGAGEYAAVAVGMSRSRVGAMARLFASPRGLKLMSRLKNSCLWVSK